jgi:hypothetical protein
VYAIFQEKLMKLYTQFFYVKRRLTIYTFSRNDCVQNGWHIRPQNTIFVFLLSRRFVTFAIFILWHRLFNHFYLWMSRRKHPNHFPYLVGKVFLWLHLTYSWVSESRTWPSQRNWSIDSCSSIIKKSITFFEIQGV